MTWTATFVNSAAEVEVKTLPLDMSARFTRISDLIVEFGLVEMREPLVKHLTGKLWEMRLKGATASPARSMWRRAANGSLYCGRL